MKHESTKPHKRRAKLLATMGVPHGQKSADAAGNMGKPDNGTSIRQLKIMENLADLMMN